MDDYHLNEEEGGKTDIITIGNNTVEEFDIYRKEDYKLLSVEENDEDDYELRIYR